jgi:uncharacterized membrane-anchored protein
MIFKKSADQVDPTWGVLLVDTREGHIDDSDAQKINFNEILENMKASSLEANQERAKVGLATLSIIGWAEPPTYDSINKKIYWAKEIKSSDSAESTLNYDIRILGRDRVITMTAIAGMSQLNQIRIDMQKVLTFTEFNKGNTYADFNPSTDKVANYGIAALVAGGVASKMGLFAKLFALILSLKKFAIVFVIALFAIVKKGAQLFFKKKES